MDKHAFDNKSIHLTSLRRSVSRRSSVFLDSDDSIELSEESSGFKEKELKIAQQNKIGNMRKSKSVDQTPK